MGHSAAELGYAPIVEAWDGATGADKQTLLLAWSSIRGINEGFVLAAAITYWLGLLLFGVGMVRSGVYPKWLG